MQGVSEIVKTYSGRWLAHNRLPLAAKAFVGADLVTGERQFVRPTVCQGVNAGEQPKLLITTIFPLDPSPSNAVAAP